MRPLKERLPGSEPDRAALDRVWAGVARDLERKTVSPWPLAFAAVSVALAVAVVGWWRAASSAPPAQVAAAEAPAAPRFARVTLEDGTELGAASALVLSDGVVRVDATEGPADVRVKGLRFLATTGRFTVRVASEQVQLDVEAGLVSVTGEAVERQVGAGQSLVQALEAKAAWLPLARAGKFAEAADALGASGRRRVAGSSLSAEDRLLFSDVAQAAGEGAVVLSQLDAVAAADAGADVRALAAWKRGLRLSEQKGEEAAAARSFEHAVELGLPGIAKKDAAARLAEAWGKAGDAARAEAWRARAAETK